MREIKTIYSFEQYLTESAFKDALVHFSDDRLTTQDIIDYGKHIIMFCNLWMTMDDYQLIMDSENDAWIESFKTYVR